MKDCVEGMNTGGVLSLPRGSGFLGVSPAPFLVASQEIPSSLPCPSVSPDFSTNKGARDT